MNRAAWDRFIDEQPLRERDVIGRVNPPHRLAEQRRLREKLKTETYVDEAGVLHWDTNDAIVPDFVFGDAGLPAPEHHGRAYARDLHAFLDSYRKNPPKLSDEQREEIRRELGPDAVDVITGKRVL